jgi:hypothetical protein
MGILPDAGEAAKVATRAVQTGGKDDCGVLCAAAAIEGAPAARECTKGANPARTVALLHELRQDY